jgi:DNA-binding HxlR family transcriptional regulator
MGVNLTKEMIKTSTRGSKTGRPIMVLFDILGRRWSMRILWELNQKNHTFNNLRRDCDDVSPSTLKLRLTELQEYDLVENIGDEGYALTPIGFELMDKISYLRNWADKWKQKL